MRDNGSARSHGRGRAVSSRSRWRGRAVGFAAAGVLTTGLAGAIVQATPAAATSTHAYRHGLVPTLAYYNAHKAQFVQAATGPNDMSFGGGISGVGVTTGHEQVYLVFWGSQWGTQSTNGSGYFTYSGDSKGVAPDLQAFFKGLGTNSETWSGVATEYCQGVSTGAFTCPSSNTSHVAYPTGGALSGVWEDTSAAAPATASGHGIGVEAENAATHFGNTTAASNRNAQYVIVSPTGTNPDNYKTQGFCAWHDYTGDSTLDGGGAVAGTTIAFTNLPYIPDAGSGCGQGFVNSPGTLDGVTIVEGHEYNETITDQYPAGGWTTPSGADAGQEIGDLCAWNANPPDKAANITLSTGSFAVQPMWANDYNGGAGGCLISHPIVSNPGGNTVTVTNPGNQTSTVGTAVSLQIQASDSGGATLTYSASGLPAGLSINSSSGLISGTPSSAGTSSVTVSASDSTGASGSTAFTWTVNPVGSNTVTVTNPGNQTTTVGTAVSLQIHATDSGGATLAYSASGLPAGLSINSSSGLVSGTPTTAGTSSVSVTAKDSTGASGSTSFTWTVNTSGSCTAKQLLGNPGFETGSASPWSATAGVVNPNGAGETAHSGSWYAWLDGYGTPHTDTLSQSRTIAAGCHTDTFSFWLWVDTSEVTSSKVDTLKVEVLNSSGTVLATLATYSNLSANNQYVHKSFSVSAYAGQTIRVKFIGRETDTGGGTTDFVIDDTALNQAS
jgi:serine protease